MDLLVSIENSGVGTWMRESSSPWAFPLFLFLHTLGMAVVAGGAVIVDLAVLGVWPREAAITPLDRYMPVMWGGLALNVITGITIFTKDASTYGRNPDFYVKLVLVASGALLLAVLRRRALRNPAVDTGGASGHSRMFAWASLACWFGAIVAGRLIAYVGPVPGL
jgi:hypothetical protein